ncbi:MAG: hypothetical protein LBD99_03280 [Candidatus Margulisbacteria bacterium]|jgi:hypothetical protein|nr:hypothetical protein [Candidatus Margulisiibacteriota bacterium]
MNNKKEVIDLGAITIDRKDPRTRQLLIKYLTAVENGDLTYNPFKKK